MTPIHILLVVPIENPILYVSPLYLRPLLEELSREPAARQGHQSARVSMPNGGGHAAKP
ncbi:MAG TPA: hypothetical protein VGL12_13240 [Roseiarcus sp.]